MRLRLTLPCALAACAACSALAACNAFSESPEDDPTLPPPPQVQPGFAGRPSGGISAADPGSSFGGVAFGPIVSSEVPPVAIQGGTLLVLRDGRTAVAADPDRDRLLIADLEDGEVLATLDLQPGDEPGRLVEDAAGRVHVVLRRSGIIATLDVDARALTDRRDACLAPQGIAYAASTDTLLVACSEGDLVELPAAGGARTHVTRIDGDLRDVSVVGERVLVSRFKSAELLELDTNLQLKRRSRPGEIAAPFGSPFGMTPPKGDFGVGEGFDGVVEPKLFSANVAFRTIADASGRVVMLHQRSQSTEIALQGEDDVHSDSGAAGAGAEEFFDDSGGGGDPYGGGDMCSAIVRPALSVDGHDGMLSGPVLPAATLAVDAAFSPDGRWVAVGVAGSPDVSQKTFGMLSQLSAFVLPTEAVMQTATPENEPGTCPLPGFDIDGASLSVGQVVAVAFDAQNRLVMQTREPSALHIIANFQGCTGCSGEVVIPFGGAPRADTGHDLFHTDAGAGLSCASCHPGGADDGHTWMFADLGPRRTQLFNMGIDETLPLHWDGDLPTFSDLVAEVFVRRMGGADLAVSQVAAMESWISTLEPGTPLRLSTDPSVVRGKALFESEEVACASCHSGTMFTNNQTVDVGTGRPLQVPSLIGVAHHAPWLHTGCAQTLRDRFDPECGGGERHGRTAHLDDGELDDLVAYLESL